MFPTDPLPSLPAKAYECLGAWEGPDGSKYLALHDPAAVETALAANQPPPPKYRCAVSTEIRSKGLIDNKSH